MEHPLSKGESQASAETPLAKVQSSAVHSMTRVVALYVVPPALAILLLVLGWELWVRLAGLPEYIVPTPSAILVRLFGDLGFFAHHGSIALIEALAGFALGAAVAFIGASLMAHSRFLERSLFPIAILVKVTPVVAVAPLFVIWFGFGSFPKILIASLITFFPVLVNGMIGLRAVNPGSLDFFTSVNASKREVYLKLRIPSSLPYLFAAALTAIVLIFIQFYDLDTESTSTLQGRAQTLLNENTLLGKYSLKVFEYGKSLYTTFIGSSADNFGSSSALFMMLVFAGSILLYQLFEYFQDRIRGHSQMMSLFV